MISVLDVSNIIYSGHYGNFSNAKPRTVSGFPVGGLFKLFGLIASNLTISDFALAFDGDQILKKELLPEYKANRIPNYSVYAEIELAKELCSMCNIPILFNKQYEADDLIYSLCLYVSILSDECDKIQIYSDDRDLSCCVSPNIELRNVTPQGKFIDFKNFTDRVVPKAKIPYNSILLYKLFNGDRSDNYKGKDFLSVTFDVLFSEIESNLKPLIEEGVAVNNYYSNYDVLKTILNETSYIPSHIKKEILEAARIVYPYVLELSDIPFIDIRYQCTSGELKNYLAYKYLNIFSKNDINMPKFLSICKTLGVPCVGANQVDKDKDLIDLIYLRGQELSSGEFMVKKAKHKQHQEETKTLLTMEFIE